ncbi:MAG: B12-binding domain-containing radical SAM protein [Fibrobacterales bacterium]
MQDYKILAINVAMRPSAKVKFLPIGLGYVLSAVKRAGYDFELYDIDVLRPTDEEIQSKLSECKWDVVLLGCIVTGYKYVKKYIEILREKNPHAFIIVGNTVASSVSETLLTKTTADVAVEAEGEITVVELLDAWEKGKDLEDVQGIYLNRKGKVQFTGYRPEIKNLDDIPMIDYDLFDVEHYIERSRFAVPDGVPIPRDQIKMMNISTARGCIARCTFCYHSFKDVKYRRRSPAHVISEIRFLQEKYGINVVALADDLTFASKRMFNEFIDQLIEEDLGIYWFCNVRNDLFKEDSDIELLVKAKKSGLLSLGGALESADERILLDMNKKMSLTQFIKQVELIKKAGLTCVTGIVLGYPNETVETIAKTYQLCLDLRVFPSTGYLLPQPNTQVYEYAKENGFIHDEEEYLMQLGDRQDLRMNLTKMSDEVFETTVNYWVNKLNDELEIGLTSDQLIKTQSYKGNR